MIILTIVIVLLFGAIMYFLNDMPNWDKTHHDGRKGSFHEISNRKELK